MKNYIRELRLARGLTLEELGVAAGGAHFATIQKLESGKMELTLSWMTKIAKALDVTINDLLTNTITQPTKAGILRKRKVTPIYRYSSELQDTPALYSHFDFTIPAMDSAATASSFENLSDISNLANINFLLQSEDVALNNDWFYLIRDDANRHFLAQFKNDPARFVHPGIGSDFRDRVLGKDRVDAIAQVICGMLLLGSTRLDATPMESADEATVSADEIGDSKQRNKK